MISLVIDFHTHCFPEKIAKSTIEKLSFQSGGLIPQTDGTKESLLQLMNKDNVNDNLLLDIFTYLLHIGKLLNLSDSEILDACYIKLGKNIERLNSDY